VGKYFDIVKRDGREHGGEGQASAGPRRMPECDAPARVRCVPSLQWLSAAMRGSGSGAGCSCLIEREAWRPLARAHLPRASRQGVGNIRELQPPQIHVLSPA
jgi:hypothetical protein